jgi:hypothetical protein
MISASTMFFPLHADADGLCFDLVPNPGFDLKTYRVQVVVEEGLFSCGCNAFEMCGLICAHIIRVMVHLNVREIPARYMLHRWSIAATTPVPDPGASSIRFGVPPMNTLRYNSLCRKMNDLASDACFDDSTYDVVSSMLDEATRLVATMRTAQTDVQQEGEGEETVNDLLPQQAQQQQAEAADAAASSILKNPPRTKPKGRPKEKEKRRKPLVELRDEANKKRKKKQDEPKNPKKPRAKRVARKKKCPYCGEEGHTVQECKYMRVAMAREAEMVREAEMAAGVELTL